MAFVLPDLPYAKDALVPYMSAETFEFHHGKHHLAYVNKANELAAGTEFESMSLEQAAVATKKTGNQKLFNQIGQIYNHNLFWLSMAPNAGGSRMPGTLEKKIAEDIGGFDALRAALIDKGTTQFGSGWAWLVMDNATGKLEVLNSANAETPLTDNKTPLLTCDVWEHAYYIDYRNARPKFLEAWIDHLANWEFAAAQLEKGPMKIAA
ncbi:MAG TPA: superoxide dismutase [Alphaproteobacteria bacterium]|nr:superoxide dismutase [Alphaproteobacteria bacterium]HNS44725.1 superoxide dismutase [Alphaproteobacteria bacterium]